MEPGELVVQRIKQISAIFVGMISMYLVAILPVLIYFIVCFLLLRALDIIWELIDGFVEGKADG